MKRRSWLEWLADGDWPTWFTVLVHVVLLALALGLWALGVYVKAWLFGKGAGIQ